MKGKISKDGYLHINRPNKGYVLQKCPHKHDNCGDECPLFGEPFDPEYPNIHVIKLAICERVFHFEEFIDERNY